MIIPEIKKILYATDLSENAHYSFSYAVSIAHHYGATITIIHVLETPGGYVYDLSAYFGAEKWEEIRKSHEEEAINTIKTRLVKFCEEVTGERPSRIDEIIVKRGNPVEEILLQTQAGDFDLVVMGAHGHGKFVDAIMGSTASRVFSRCKKPVLVVRLPEGEDQTQIGEPLLPLGGINLPRDLAAFMLRRLQTLGLPLLDALRCRLRARFISA